MKRKNKNAGGVPSLDSSTVDIDVFNKRRKREEMTSFKRSRSRSDSDDQKNRLTRSNSEPFASEFDEMWNDDGVGGEESTVEMKDSASEDERSTYSSLRSFLRPMTFRKHPGGRKAPPPTPDHVLMPPPLMRTKLRKSVFASSPGMASSVDNSGLRFRASSPTNLRAPPPSPQAYQTKVAFIRPSMPPSPILRSPRYQSSPRHHQSSPLHPTLEDCPAKAMYSLTGTSPSFGPRQATRSPPPLPLQGSASPATFLSQQLNAHHLTHRAVRQSTTAVLQSVAANITIMKAAADISSHQQGTTTNNNNHSDDGRQSRNSDAIIDGDDAMDQEE